MLHDEPVLPWRGYHLNPFKSMSAGTKPNETKLRETLKENPADWETRKQLAHLLYDNGSFAEAADLVWETDEIPSIDVELAFAARILAKASPRKAIRLLTALLEHNRGKAVQNLGMANALMHHGMVLQASRFYGAAMEADPDAGIIQSLPLEADPTMGNPDLEHFMLWIDDDETLWGNFGNRRPVLGQLPWMRDPKEAMKLTSRINTHTTPIKLPSLKEAAGEELRNDLYQQKAAKGADITPPPAVTIPIDRVAEKDRVFDEELGAPNAPAQGELSLEKAAKPATLKRELPKPDFNAASKKLEAAATLPPVEPAAEVPVVEEPVAAAAVPKVPAPPVSKPKATLPPAGGAPAVAKPTPTVPPPGGVPAPAATLPPAGGGSAPGASLPTLDDFEVEELEPVEPVKKKKVGLPPLRK